MAPVCAPAMLTAWNRHQAVLLILPDHERREDLEAIRDQARRGDVVCPTCQQLLWLRAGEIRIPHFGHRTLSNCPQGRVPAAVLQARYHLYSFFKARVDSGKLPGSIELEPRLPECEDLVSIDLLLRRKDRSTVAIAILATSLKPDLRWALKEAFGKLGWIFRPVFLKSRLNPVPKSKSLFLLDTTQRAFRLKSAYDLRPPHLVPTPGTLHFIDAAAGEWHTLRALRLEHEPQEFRAGIMRVSRFQELLWSEGAGEWVHPGEAEALREHREKLAAEERRRKDSAQRAEAERARSRIPPVKPPPVETMESTKTSGSKGDFDAPDDSKDQWEEDDESEEEEDLESGQEEETFEEQLPPWLSGGLVCVGCGQRSTDWQNASPGRDACVCKSCFRQGIRLNL